MNHDRYDDSYIRGILNTVKNVAVVGASPREKSLGRAIIRNLRNDGFEGALDDSRRRGVVSGWKAGGLPWTQT